MAQHCTFTLAGHQFGLPVDDVQEVLRDQVITPVPTGDATVAGLTNLRGQIVTALDLRVRCDLPPRGRDERAMSIVIRRPSGPLSLLVDAIGDVIDVDGEAVDPIPATLTGPARHLLRGAVQLPGRLLLLLDTAAAAASPAAS